MAHRASNQASSRRRAFTLVELVTVIVIAAVLASVAIPAVGSFTAARSSAAAHRVARDLTFARHRALSSGCRTWAVFHTGAGTLSILSEPVGSPGRFNAITLTDAGTGRPMVCALSSAEFGGVSIVSVSFDGAAEVGFDWLGRPLNNTGSLLAAQGLVTLSSGKSVAVQPETGLATVQ